MDQGLLVTALWKVIGSSDILSDGLALLDFKGDKDEIEVLKKWLSQLNLSAGRAPAGTKNLLADLKFLQRQIDSMEEFGGALNISNIKATISRWDEATINLIAKKLVKKKDQPDTIPLKHATYHNKSVLNFNSFKAKSRLIDQHLDTLKGFHAKALEGDLNIIFVKKELTKAGATYKTEKDEIYIRPDKVASGDNYGSFIYVITHELGHRYERLIRQKTDFDKPEWYTTKYSRVDTLAGGEQFAELFALSHWPDKYAQYEDQISKFLEALT